MLSGFCRSTLVRLLRLHAVFVYGYVLPHLLDACSQPTDAIIQWVVDTIKLHLEVSFILLLGSTDSIEHLIDLVLGVDLWYQLGLCE
ncbi:hypothetical protein DY000_02023988 [Brassica cretica]|nr:hypothetical protein DY000_02023988 [Brassica cretica]